MVTVFIVSRHSMFGQGIASLLRQQPGLETVALEEDPDLALAHIKETNPDVVILDDDSR